MITVCEYVYFQIYNNEAFGIGSIPIIYENILTRKDILVSIFALVFWPHSLISALLYLGFMLLQSLDFKQKLTKR